MKQGQKNECTLRITLPANELAVEEFFGDFRQRVRSCLSPKHGFAAELLAREALNNALQHGCRYDPSKTICCLFRLKGCRLTMVVEDSGEGFDWRAVKDRQADELTPSGRGMELMRSVATRVRFNRKGNKVTIVKQCDLRERS